MLKRTLSLVLTLGLLTLCTACFDTDPAPSTPTTTTVARDTTTLAVTTTTAPAVVEDAPFFPEEDDTTEPTDPPPTDTVYAAETLPFSVVLPASWQGHYAVREENNSVKFYELNNHLYDGSGLLFTVRFMSAAAYEEDMFPSYQFLGEFGEQCVVALFPTDVQSSEEYIVAYGAMSADVESILETFVYNG